MIPVEIPKKSIKLKPPTVHTAAGTSNVVVSISGLFPVTVGGISGYCKRYTVKKRFASFPSLAGMSLPNSPRAGIMTS